MAALSERYGLFYFYSSTCGACRIFSPVIRALSRVTKPGRRVYAGAKEIPQVRQGLGVSIVSTPKGVMSDAAARNANVGGEVLCTVF